ncbi:cutinase family protein [Mycobacterium sp. NPDC048908]|uniref:cutinase family protein n=1 Tax=Mycobacterium sp. NPDC048908 TaxID=3364292 RepID=UPI00371919E6
MPSRYIAVLIGAAAAAWLSPLTAPPQASALPCPDVEVVFARGTTEDPGVGPTGQAFVDALRPRLGPRTMTVYPVDYPATIDFPTAIDGVRDASAHVEATAANCPNTKIVLGGFSQGAAVAGFVTANVIPDGAPDGVPNPMPSDVANHVAAVALFGKPNARFMRAINEPQIDVGPAYAAKTIDLCVPDDFVCSNGRDFNAHTQYVESGMVDQAATFTANHVLAALPPAPPQAPAPTAPPQASTPPPPPADPAAPAPPPYNALRPLPPGTLMRCDSNCHIIGPA